MKRMTWLPWPGHHTLELVDRQGVVVDSVKFEVRGAFAKIKTKG
jgi:penicillin-binding protein 1C